MVARRSLLGISSLARHNNGELSVSVHCITITAILAVTGMNIGELAGLWLQRLTTSLVVKTLALFAGRAMCVQN